MGRRKLGEVEHHVLLSLMRLGRSGYSVPIVREIEERTGRPVSQAAVFIALRRLERKNLVRSHLRAAVPPERGRPRRIFHLEDCAIPRLVEARQSLEALWSGLDGLTEV